MKRQQGQRGRLRSVRAWVALTPLALAGLQPGTAAADEPAITIKSSTVTPATIIGGSGGTQTITLSRPAPAGGTSVWLYYDNIYRETTGGGWVRVPAGQTSVTFPFRASAPRATRTGTIYGQAQGTDLTPIATFAHQAADPATRAVSALRFSRTTMIDGTALTGTVFLQYPAPAGGLTVSLWSNTAYDPASAYLPSFVTVPAGRTSVDFQARAAATGPWIIRPSADLGTSLVTRELIVVPKAFAISDGTPPRNGTNRLVLGIGDAPNPSGTVVSLKSDNPEVKVPAQVTVPAGQPGVAITYSMGNFTFGSPWPKITATWNGQAVTATIFPQ